MTRSSEQLALVLALLGMASGCEPGPQRMVPLDGRQVAPGARSASAPSWNAEELEGDIERTSALEDDFAERLAASDATGGYLVVIKDGEILTQKGFGEVDVGGAAVTEETLFLQASVSKMFLALGALSLAERGELDLDASMDGYVSGAPSTITPRLALSHRAGVPDTSACEDGLDTPSAWASVHAGDTLWSPPGVLFNYSNAGFALMGAALEGLSGRRLPEVIEDAVFAPAGAATATYAMTGGASPRAVGQHREWPVPEGFGCGLIEAAGGAWLSAEDTTALLRAFLGETTVFSDALLSEFTTAQTSVSGGGQVSYGHGVFVEHYDGELVAYHLGGLPWFGAGMLFIPGRDFGLAFAVNAGDFMPFLQQAVELYFGPEFERAALRPDLSRLDEYAGIWQDPIGHVGRFRVETSTSDLTLVPLGEHDIWPLPVDGTFWPDPEGNIRYFATRIGVAIKQAETEGE